MGKNPQSNKIPKDLILVSHFGNLILKKGELKL